MSKSFLPRLLSMTLPGFIPSCTPAPDTHQVYDLPSRAAAQHTARFSLSEQQAWKLISNSRKFRDDRYFAAVVDDCYFFGSPEKASIQFTGVYVNGFTGRTEYRTTRQPGYNYGPFSIRRRHAVVIHYDHAEVIRP